MSDESKYVNSSECTPAEIAFAACADAFEVSPDGLGWVRREWLERWRKREASALMEAADGAVARARDGEDMYK